ncbi:MAG: SufS family cysteine desulfurase [Candidatus Eisenbacteria bacterium]
MLDVRKIRERFPAFREKRGGAPLIYFDNASTTQKPDVVIERIASYYRSGCGNVHRGAHALTGETTRLYEGARETVARFIGASDTAEIVFTRNATDAIHLAAFSWAWERIGEGDEIVLSEMEHSSNLVPWQFLAREKNAELRFLRIGQDMRLHAAALDKILSPRTKLAALIHVSNSIGVVNPAEELAAVARTRGVPILIDGAQSVPHIPVDVGRIGCDFFVFSGHKMLGPTGVGVLYARKSILDSMRPFFGGGGTVLEAGRAGSTFNEAPWKLEAGTPSVADALGLEAAIGFIEEIGIEAIREHERILTETALDELGSISRIVLYGPETSENRAGVLSFNLEGVRPLALGRFLDERGIAVRAGDHCTQLLLRSMGVAATARASFYLYNTKEEIARFASALREAAALPRSAWSDPTAAG